MQRRRPLSRSKPLTSTGRLAAKAPQRRRKALRRQSSAKRAENAERARLRPVLVEERGELCECGCGRIADDMHEVLPRSRGGSATDPENIRLVARQCHQWIHEHPQAAKLLGLLK